MCNICWIRRVVVLPAIVHEPVYKVLVVEPHWTYTRTYCVDKHTLCRPLPRKPFRGPIESTPEEFIRSWIPKLSGGLIPYLADRLEMMGMAYVKAGRAILSVRIPAENVSSHIIPRVNSRARMPKTKAISTAEQVREICCTWKCYNSQRPNPGV